MARIRSTTKLQSHPVMGGGMDWEQQTAAARFTSPGALCAVPCSSEPSVVLPAAAQPPEHHRL